MGCTTSTSKNPLYKSQNHHSLVTDPKLITELDKWNSQQINLARKHFIKGLSGNTKTLDYQGFKLVFPLIEDLPKVNRSLNIRRYALEHSHFLIRTNQKIFVLRNSV